MLIVGHVHIIVGGILRISIEAYQPPMIMDEREVNFEAPITSYK